MSTNAAEHGEVHERPIPRFLQAIRSEEECSAEYARIPAVPHCSGPGKQYLTQELAHYSSMRRNAHARSRRMHVLGGRSVCRHDQAKSALIRQF